MRKTRVGLVLMMTGFLAGVAGQTPETQRSPRQALQVFNDLIGSWRGTGVPAGSPAAQQKGFWTETITWEWHFKNQDAWLKVNFAKGKYFQTGELRYLPGKDLYQLTLTTPGKEVQKYQGKIGKRALTLERDFGGATERLVLTLLHATRFLYRLDVRPASKSLFRRHYQVGATKEGIPFAAADGRPECIVSGGLGSIAVAYQGQTYYVCCSGCRAEFQQNPAKYIKEFQAKKKGK